LNRLNRKNTVANVSVAIRMAWFKIHSYKCISSYTYDTVLQRYQ